MRILITLLGVLALSGCLRPLQQTILPADPGPAKGPEVIVLVSQTGAAGRRLMKDVAVSCWLDGIVRGAQMIVKPDGNLVIVGETTDLVAADYLGLKGSRGRWRLSGSAIADPDKTRRMVQSLDRAMRTGETRCPAITG